jgi:hypothetical protein
MIVRESHRCKTAKRELRELLGRTQGIQHQISGYAGRLTFDEQYRREKADLQRRWWGLPDRPPLPLESNVADRPGIPVASIEPYRPFLPDPDVERFLIDFGRFMRRWGLCRMVTWDLPLAQGPAEEVPLGLATSLLGPDHPVDVIPSYYDIPSDFDLRESIRGRQREAAADDGITLEHPVTDISSRAGRASQFESAFQLWLIERAVTSRYGRPRGMITRLTLAFSGYLGVLEDRIPQLRRIYSRFLEVQD